MFTTIITFYRMVDWHNGGSQGNQESIQILLNIILKNVYVLQVRSTPNMNA